MKYLNGSPWARRGKRLAIGVVALILLFLAVTGVVSVAWNHERAGRTISGWASASIAGRGGATQQAFTFGSVEYPWLGAVASVLGGPPVRVEVRDVTIWDPEGNEVLAAERVRVGLRLNRLVWAQVLGALPGGESDVELHFVGAIIDRVRCQIAQDGSGRANLVAAFSRRRPKAPGEAPGGGGMVISVEGATVHDGRYGMRFPGWDGEIDQFRMRVVSLRYSSFAAETRDDSPAFTYQVARVDAPTGALTIGGFPFPLERVVATDFRAEAPRRQDMQFTGTARVRGATVGIEGKLPDLYTEALRAVDLRLDVRHGAGLLASLPSRTLLKGDVSVTAHLLGPSGDVVIDGRVRGARLKVVGLTVRHIAGDYRLEHRALQLTGLTSDVAGGHASGQATVDWKDRTWSADLELRGLQAGKMGSLAVFEVVAYLEGIPRLVLRAGLGDEDSREKLRIGGIDLSLYRRPRDLFPHRITLAGALDR